jgi:uncharacterized protein
MIIVSDTSPITNLFQIGKLHILEILFQQIVIPSKVFEELAEMPQQLDFIEKQEWIIVQPAKNRILVEHLELNLDEGESEAIALAIELQAAYLIIDEYEGRAIAEQMGLKIVGLLGILIQAKTDKIIDKIKPILDELITQAGFRINPKLYTDVLKRAGE